MEFSQIKGLGQKRIDCLKKAGFSEPAGLLLFFPKKYIDTGSLSSTQAVHTGDTALFLGTLTGSPIRKTVRRGLFFVRAEFFLSESEKISCIWFNNPYIKNNLKEGTSYYISGKVKKSGARVEISSPEVYASDSSNGIIPVYSSAGGLSRTLLRNIISDILDKVTIRSFIPVDIAQRFSIMPLAQALKILHRPQSMLQIENAKKSISLEILSCELAVFFLKKDRVSGRRVFEYEQKERELSALLENGLPFVLSPSQKNCLDGIIASLTGPIRMNRLLQGDVGSGKTIVAMIAMYFAFLNGYQSALMAPTEILAKQHYENACRLFEPLGVRVCLLTGSQGKNERADKLFNIRTGQCDFIIGTHAVVQEAVEFSRLSLIVTDEQQRFGVEQRGKLENKSVGTDCLILSATPIPRTLALILYGELEHTSIQRISSKKAQIITRIVPKSKLEDMYTYVANKASKGEKTYIVCPRIEEDEDEVLLSAKNVYSTLKKNSSIQPHLALLHGQMKEDEKNRVMQSFYDGQTKILVSTTVVEVGIDVSDATTMIIFNPERYGLSQLHQLRGRVGRGELDSYCFLVCDDSSETSETLKFFLGCDDGFELAEYDFRSRGAGDFLGIRQHGSGSGLNYAVTKEIILDAKNIAQALLDNKITREELLTGLSGERISYIKNLALN